VIPGGVGNPDTMRMDENAVALVGEFFEQGKPVGVICHGRMLVEAGCRTGPHGDLVAELADRHPQQGRQMTKQAAEIKIDTPATAAD
jgi:putative intracellular protease/amidase